VKTDLGYPSDGTDRGNRKRNEEEEFQHFL